MSMALSISIHLILFHALIISTTSTATSTPSFATEAEPSAIHGSGYSVYFDGRVSNQIIQVASESCAATDPSTSSSTLTPLEQAHALTALPVANLIGSRPDRTMMGWIKVPAHSYMGDDVHLFGHPYAHGPRLFLSTLYSHPSLKYLTNPQGYQEGYLKCQQIDGPYPADLLDGRWHHVALSQSIEWTEAYIDGEAVWRCYMNISDPANIAAFALPSTPNSLIHIGCYDSTLDSPNASNFAGYMDDIRIFASYYNESSIRSMMRRGWMTTAEAERAQVWFTFDDGGAAGTTPNQVYDYSGNGNHGYMGLATSTLKKRWPLYVASNSVPNDASVDKYPGNGASIYLTNAPILGRQKLIKSRQITIPPTNVNDHDILVTLEPLNATVHISTQFTIMNVTVGPNYMGGLFVPIHSNGSLGAGTTFAAGSTITFQGISFIYRPALNEFGTVVSFVILPGGSLVGTASVNVDILLTPNVAPIVGGGGGALFCDGVNDYAFSPSFEWPMMNATLPDGATKLGGVPHTVEFWAYVTPESELDSAVFSVGGGEVGAGWVDWAQPYRQGGRFIARVPFAGGNADHWIQMDSHSVDIKQYYYRWTHFAFQHEQVNGTNSWIYINGELVSHESSGGHTAVGQDSPSSRIVTQHPVKTLTLCTWTFWSEVYHRGHLDDFRIWTRIRSQAEIQQDMHRTLNGNEANLLGYWNFDDIPAVGFPRVNGDSRILMDSTPNGNHLYMGGCAKCDSIDQYDRGWMPYDTKHGAPPPANLSEQDPGGPGYRVCLPSAKTLDSPSIELGIVYGAVSHCFGGPSQSNPDTFPTRTISTAPIGGHIYQQLTKHHTGIEILLNSTDPDRTDDVQYIITEIPPYSTLTYTTDGAIFIPISVGTKLPPWINTVYYRANLGAGGAPIGSLSYQVTDGLLTSDIMSSEIYVQCPRGMYIDQTTHLCANCTIGTYQSVESLHTSCLPCARHEYQDQTGSLSCKKCQRGAEFQPNRGSGSCQQCSDFIQGVDGNGQLIANDYQCQAQFTRATTKSRQDNGVTTGSDGSLTIDILNQTSTLGVFDSKKPIMAYIASLPQVGKLYQAITTSTSDIATATQTYRHDVKLLATGDLTTVPGASLADPFFSLADSTTQYVIGIVGEVSTRDGHPASAIIGPPDVLDYDTSPQAWSPIKSMDGSDYPSIVVAFATPMFIQSITVFESYNPGAIVSIEAWNEKTQTWFNFWYLSTSDLSAATSAAARLPPALRAFTPPESCPTLFLCDTIRITWQSSLVTSQIEVDAIAMNGVTHQSDLGRAWIDHTKIVYTPPPTSQLPLTVGYQDSFSYIVRDCSSSPTTLKSSMQLSFPAQPMPVYKPNQGLQTAVYVTSGLGIAYILVVMLIVIIYRNAVVIRSSNFPFCLATLFFHLPLAIGSIFYALQPDSGAYVCHARPWCTCVGVVGILAALVTKTNQNRAIFNNPKLVTVALTKAKLAGMIGTMLGLQFILLIVFSALPLTNPLLSEGTGKTSGSLVWQCAATSGHSTELGSPSYISDASFGIWLGFQFGYIFTFLVSVCYLAFSVRSIPQAFNESSHIMNTVFGMAFFLCLLIPLQFLIDGDVNALILIRGVGQNLACIFFISVLYVPKLYWIATGKANDKTLQQTMKSAPTINFSNQTSDKTQIQTQLGHSSGPNSRQPGAADSGLGMTLAKASSTGTVVLPVNGMALPPKVRTPGTRVPLPLAINKNASLNKTRSTPDSSQCSKSNALEGVGDGQDTVTRTQFRDNGATPTSSHEIQIELGSLASPTSITKRPIRIHIENASPLSRQQPLKESLLQSINHTTMPTQNGTDPLTDDAPSLVSPTNNDVQPTEQSHATFVEDKQHQI